MPNALTIEIRCYRYTCPDCGMTDAELGHLATADEVHCMVCLIDENRHVLLRRWLVEGAEQVEAGGSPAGSVEQPHHG